MFRYVCLISIAVVVLSYNVMADEEDDLLIETVRDLLQVLGENPSSGNTARDSKVRCEVQTGNCNKHGKCGADMRGVGDYICYCDKGWTGTTCKTPPKGANKLRNLLENLLADME